jgi:hypothetical protein
VMPSPACSKRFKRSIAGAMTDAVTSPDGFQSKLDKSPVSRKVD